MTRDVPRLFSYAALAALGVAAVVAVQALAPPWRGIQRARLEEQVAAAREDVARAEEQLAERQRSLAYRRAEEAVEREAARLADPAVADRLAAVDRRLLELGAELAAAMDGAAPPPADDGEREELRMELVRRSGTPGVSPAELQELEARLAALGGAPATAAERVATLEAERTSLRAEERTLRGPHEEAVAALAAEGADLVRAEARVARLLAWDRGVKEFERADGEVERCTTCHPGMDDLDSSHPGLGVGSPYQGFGCTVCHGGNGRALVPVEAHRSLTLRPWTVGNDYSLETQLQALSSADRQERADAIATLRALTGQDLGYRVHDDDAGRAAAAARWRDWWAAAGGYYRPPYPDGLRAFGHDASGRPERYAGSGDCLRCHESRQRRHVERWRATKFQSYARLDEVDDPTPCLRCHTTGYDERTGEYVQQGVTCEGCHGPGVGYTAVMEAAGRLQAAGRVDEGEELLDWVSSEMRTRMEEQNVCVDCHDPFGVKDLAFEHPM